MNKVMAFIKYINHKYCGFLKCLLLLAPMMIVNVTSNATTIEKIGTHELVSESVFVFEGVVEDVFSDFGKNGFIYTHIKFSVIDVLKGDSGREELELIFAGGTVGITKDNFGITYPSLGEHGIYFVASFDDEYNPLVGWFQGHFVISNNNYVQTSNKKIVSALKYRTSQGSSEISFGDTFGVETVEQFEESANSLPSNVLTPLELYKFKELIRSFVGE